MPPLTHCLPSGSLGTGEVPVPNISTTNLQVRAPAGSKRGVMVFCHSITNGDPANAYSFGGTAWDAMSTALVADGWVTISAPFGEDRCADVIHKTCMQNDFTNDTGHGSRYLTSWLHTWDHIIGWIQQTYGNWPVVVVGLSWGGWHALKICSNKMSTLTGYIIHEPVVVISELASLGWDALTTTGADASEHELDAVSVPGLLGWGTADTTVGSAHQIAMYNNAHGAGQPITSLATGDVHAMTSGAATSIEAFVTATLDPLAPAVH